MQRPIAQFLFDAAILFLTTVFLVWFSLSRLVAGDEGFYILASRLVASGEIPYVDFFYPQAPLLPYIYGFGLELFGESWHQARIVSAFFAAMLALALYARTKELLGRGWGTCALVLFCCCGFILPWMTIVKTYALSTLLLFVAYLALTRERQSLWTAITAGLAFRLAVNARIFFVVAFPVFLLWIWRQSWPELSRPLLTAFAGATFIALLPLCFFAFRDFDAFWFNNMEYHLIRSNQTAAEALWRKLLLVASLFGVRESRNLVGIQFALLSFAAIIGALLSLRERRRLDLAFPLALVLAVVSLLPTPSYAQYFSVTAPFLMVCVCITAHSFLSTLRAATILPRALGYAALGCVLVGYFYSTPLDIERFTRTGYGVNGIFTPAVARYRTLAALEEVSDALDDLGESGDEVIAAWPGYVVGSELDMLPGLENNFGLVAGGKLGADERRLYEVLSREELCDSIEAGLAPLAVFPKNAPSLRCLSAALSVGGYTLAKRLPGVDIHIIPDKS